MAVQPATPPQSQAPQATAPHMPRYSSDYTMAPSSESADHQNATAAAQVAMDPSSCSTAWRRFGLAVDEDNFDIRNHSGRSMSPIRKLTVDIGLPESKRASDGDIVARPASAERGRRDSERRSARPSSHRRMWSLSMSQGLGLLGADSLSGTSEQSVGLPAARSIRDGYTMLRMVPPAASMAHHLVDLDASDVPGYDHSYRLSGSCSGGGAVGMPHDGDAGHTHAQRDASDIGPGPCGESTLPGAAKSKLVAALRRGRLQHTGAELQAPSASIPRSPDGRDPHAEHGDAANEILSPEDMSLHQRSGSQTALGHALPAPSQGDAPARPHPSEPSNHTPAPSAQDLAVQRLLHAAAGTILLDFAQQHSAQSAPEQTQRRMSCSSASTCMDDTHGNNTLGISEVGRKQKSSAAHVLGGRETHRRAGPKPGARIAVRRIVWLQRTLSDVATLTQELLEQHHVVLKLCSTCVLWANTLKRLGRHAHGRRGTAFGRNLGVCTAPRSWKTLENVKKAVEVGEGGASTRRKSWKLARAQSQVRNNLSSE